MSTMESLIVNLTSNPLLLGLAVILAIVVLFGVIKKLFKLALVIIAVLILYLAFLTWTGKEVPTDVEGIKESVKVEVIKPAFEKTKKIGETIEEKAKEKAVEELKESITESETKE